MAVDAVHIGAVLATGALPLSLGTRGSLALTSGGLLPLPLTRKVGHEARITLTHRGAPRLLGAAASSGGAVSTVDAVSEVLVA